MSKVAHKLNEKFVGANCVRPYFEEIAKKENGITLIALIITVIVMLILTGVTLSITLGDNGLVNKAKEATEATEVAMAKELLLSAVVGAIGVDGQVDFNELDSNLPEGFTGSNGTYTLEESGLIFTVGLNGTIDNTTDKEPEQVGLFDGTYYHEEIPEEYSIEIKNNRIYLNEENTVTECKISQVNEEEQTLIWLMKYEDGETGEIEEWEETRNYRIIYKNGEIDNIIIEFASVVLYQNMNGITHELDGIYVSDDGTSALKFYQEDGRYEEGRVDEAGEFRFYGSNSGTYYTVKNADCWWCGSTIMNLSSDLNTITYWDTTYTKQSN